MSTWQLKFTRPQKVHKRSPVVEVERQILELEVGDQSGSIRLVLWDEKIIPDLKEGDASRLRTGSSLLSRAFGE